MSINNSIRSSPLFSSTCISLLGIFDRTKLDTLSVSLDSGLPIPIANLHHSVSRGKTCCILLIPLWPLALLQPERLRTCPNSISSSSCKTTNRPPSRRPAQLFHCFLTAGPEMFMYDGLAHSVQFSGTVRRRRLASAPWPASWYVSPLPLPGLPSETTNSGRRVCVTAWRLDMCCCCCDWRRAVGSAASRSESVKGSSGDGAREAERRR